MKLNCQVSGKVMRTISLGLLALISTTPAAAELVGRVVAVLDGDTVTVQETGQSSRDIRLSRIDAPERSQAFGQHARQSLSAMVYGKDVRIEVSVQDRQTLTMGKLWLDGVDINLEQLRRGMAWLNREQATDPNYHQVEAQARSQRVGLWSQPNAQPPWEYRNLGVRWRE
jgi:endonuclease YncB( thermonuclease family)